MLLGAMVSSAVAQSNIIKGKVVDKLTREPLESAVVRNLSTGKSVPTNHLGNFTIIAGSDSLRVSFTGYQPIVMINSGEKSQLIELEKSAIQLKDVTIGNSNRLDTYKILSSLDLNMQPVRSAQDLLRLVPGLFIAQHMGGGKAEQIFLRGFDADHGTDINVAVDGIPVNMVTHAHGQGYADMHFLIPETVASYDFGKGPYYPDKGDFTTGGFVEYKTRSVLDQDMIKLEAGRFNTYRGVAMINLLGEKAKKQGQNAYIAAEGLFSDGGPFQLPEHFNRYNLFGKYTGRLSDNTCLMVSASAFRSNWRASGELPDRSAAEGYVSNRFGVIDSAQGGHTRRTNANVKLTTDLPGGFTFENQLYYSHYTFDLTSNFTYYDYYPDTGDEFRQQERRDLGGYNGKVTKIIKAGNNTWTSLAGAGARYDHISPLETTHTEHGNFLDLLQLGKANELNANAWAEETLLTGKWLFNTGIRFDYFHFNYQDLLSATETNTSGNGKGKPVFSPKINVVYNFNDKLQLYLKAAKGFHSNDARVVIANKGFDVIPAAYGADLGVNWKPLPRLYVNSALWYLYLQQEFTFGQDLSDLVEGPVSPSGRTVRVGWDVSLRYQFNDWLFANLNANVARPRALDSLKGHDYIELAPTLTSTAGLDFRLKNGINGGISYRYLHDRAANADYSLTARGYFITDLAVNYTQKRYELGLSIENLFNRAWDESQIAYTSRFKNETAPVEQVSYTPGVPFFAKLKLSVFF